MNNSTDSPIHSYDKSNDLFHDYLTSQYIRNGMYEHHRNLQVGVNHPVGTTDTTVDVTADYITVEGIGLSSINLTCDLATSGVNGLDTGTIANSTFYYLWLIASARAERVAILASLSATSPTMPVGYHVKRRMASVRTNASGKLFRFYFVGNGWFIWNEDLSADPFAQSFLETVTFTAKTVLAPSVCRFVRIGLSTGVASNVGARPTGSNWTYNSASCAIIGAGAGDGPQEGPLELPCDSSQSIDVRSGVATPATNIVLVTHGFWMEV